MTNHATDWHKTLAQVTGLLVRGEQRVTTHELLTVHLGVPITDQLVGGCGVSCASLDGKVRGGCDGASALPTAIGDTRL